MNMQQYVSETVVLLLVWLLLHDVIKARNSLLLILFPPYKQKKMYLPHKDAENESMFPDKGKYVAAAY